MRMIRALPRPSIYRGWWVVSAPFLAAAVGTGAGQYGFGVFIEPLEETFGWSRTQINASLSFTAAGSMMAPLMGWIMDRYGVRHIMAVMLAIIAVSYLLRPQMTELWHWYALSLMQYVGYTGASMLSAGKLVGLWFQRTRGRVMGITAMGNNFGGLVMPPLLGALLALYSWEGAFFAIGLLSALLVAYTLAAVRDFPTADQLGGEFAERPAAASGSIVSGATLDEARRGRAFYAIAASVVIGTFTYSAILPQIIPHLTDGGSSLGTATLLLSVFAIMGMAGKFVMGLLAERITSRRALMANFVGKAIFLVAMIRADVPLLMWAAVPLYGFFNGAFGALFNLVVQDAFGVRHFGAIMGVISFATLLSFFAGPILAGLSFDVGGSYAYAFAGVAGLFVVGALSLSLARTD